MRDPSDVMPQLSESLFKEEIKKVALSRRCLVVAVGGNWRIEVGGRTGKLRRGVARRLDEENARENPTAQDR